MLDDAEAVRHDLDLACGSAVAHVVERDARGAEELGERRTVFREAREHEAAIALDARRFLHAAVGIVGAEAGAGVARFHHRDLAQPAVVVEGPGVVGAAEELAAVAVAVAHHHVAAMRAAVIEHVDAAVRAAHHQHRLAADLHLGVVAGLRHLRLVAAIDPDALVDALHLELEDIRVGVDLAAHAVGLDEFRQIGNTFLQHGISSEVPMII